MDRGLDKGLQNAYRDGWWVWKNKSQELCFPPFYTHHWDGNQLETTQTIQEDEDEDDDTRRKRSVHAAENKQELFALWKKEISHLSGWPALLRITIISNMKQKQRNGGKSSDQTRKQEINTQTQEKEKKNDQSFDLRF